MFFKATDRRPKEDQKKVDMCQMKYINRINDISRARCTECQKYKLARSFFSNFNLGCLLLCKLYHESYKPSICGDIN